MLSGAGVVAEVGVAVGTGPLVLAGRGHAVAPAAVGLEPVVEGAQAGEVVRVGARVGVVGVVGLDVVELAAAGGA